MRLIDADALYEFVKDQMEKETGAYTRGKNKAFNIIKSALHNECATPTIEAKPVIHSEWEITDIDHAHGRKCYHCPECGEDEWRYDESNFCSNCGVRMDGGKNG